MTPFGQDQTLFVKKESHFGFHKLPLERSGPRWCWGFTLLWSSCQQHPRPTPTHPLRPALWLRSLAPLTEEEEMGAAFSSAVSSEQVHPNCPFSRGQVIGVQCMIINKWLYHWEDPQEKEGMRGKLGSDGGSHVLKGGKLQSRDRL